MFDVTSRELVKKVNMSRVRDDEHTTYRVTKITYISEHVRMLRAANQEFIVANINGKLIPH